MKVLSAVLVAVNAGGKTLSAAESEQHLRNFNLFCSPAAGGRSEANQDGNTMYYCKTADEPITVKVDHEEELRGGETPKQVIYIQPPPYVYRHNIGVKGSPGSPQQTEIFVLPQKATHELSISDQRSQTQATKPSLYFLTGSADESAGVGAIRRPANSPPPGPGPQPGPSGQGQPSPYIAGPTYLPPRPNTNYGQPAERTQRNVHNNNLRSNFQPSNRAY